jgi:hypothetical protein
MIFKQWKLILLHIPKTGLTSLEQLLCRNRRTDHELKSGFGNKHLDAARAEIMWGKVFHDPSWTVCVAVRHPLDLVASQYVQSSRLNGLEFSTAGFNRWLQDLGPDDPILLTSKEVDSHLEDLPDLPTSSAGMSQSRFLEMKTPRSYRVIRFEHLLDDFKALLDEIGHPPAGFSHIGNRGASFADTFPTEIVKYRARINYRAMYNEKSEEIVRSRLACDFVKFGYE